MQSVEERAVGADTARRWRRTRTNERGEARLKMMEVTVPEGISAGHPMIVQAPDGVRIQVTVPPGLWAGQKFRVALPAAADTASSSTSAARSSSASAARTDAAKRKADAEAKAAREKEMKKRAEEEAVRKREMRREAEAFKREMEELMTGGSADPSEMLSSTSDVAMAMPPSDLASAPSPIAAVPGSLGRLAFDRRMHIQPLLNDINGLLTFNKINRVLAEWAAKPAFRMKLDEEQASAILDSIENQLRWPQALETLMPALDLSARQWAAKVTDDKRTDYDRQPKGLQPVWG